MVARDDDQPREPRVPALAAGSGDGWMLDPWTYHRAQRTVYRALSDEEYRILRRTRRSIGRGPEMPKPAPVRRAVDLLVERQTTPAIFSSMWGESRGAYQGVFPELWAITGGLVPNWTTERPYVVLRLDDEVRMLDLYGDADRWGNLRVEPAWYPDFIRWMEERFRSAGWQRGLDDVLPRWQEFDRLTDIQRGPLVRELLAWYARDRKIQVVIGMHPEVTILDPDCVRIDELDDGRTLVVGYERLVIEHNKRPFPHPPHEVLVWCGLAVPIMDGVRSALHDLRKGLDLLVRINGPMRQRDHDLAQDRELDRLSIVALHRFLGALAELGLMAGSISGLQAREMARRMPMPTADDLERTGRRPQYVETHLKQLVDRVDGVPTEMHGDVGHVRSPIDGIRFYVPPLIEDFGWPQGARFASMVPEAVWRWGALP